eukprot:CAMPEP_0172532350 /NCGR_PEP_ID=MMETSP1067-20121228/5439_1 /TAXON_ID=265564 ORGANISM="Thalassiosira punctigera, Strain Tpunct2005C2" /NCGR_SAMPLE_ID=MMETSP1067 /ASSEMBLY_ACC=CAM_ASM_000444 /LENGTH=456 /DNA_ID=CAMNT_0013316857 /DNA_START=178 /DNA_END=1545 /DNA_ORIENTATION=+
MSCRPPTNTTYLVIGQDLFSINEYVTSQYNYSLHQHINSVNDTSNEVGSGQSISSLVPSAFMVYTDLATLKGLWEPTDYGSGVEYADGVLDLYPSLNQNASHKARSSTGIQIGLWLDGTRGCIAINMGEMEDQINLLISYLERSRASKIFLRLGYEFDNPSFGYSDNPAMYILAFRKIVSDCRNKLSEEATRRVLFVWHSWAAPMAKKSLSLDSFYPGDEFVDWIGVSIFQQFFPWSPPWGGGVQDVENVLDFAHEHDKPTIIAESTPFGGIELMQASHDANDFLENNEYDHDDWGRWFGKVLDVINKHDVSMWCYINCDWESQPMWHNVGFGETRLSSNQNVMSHWHEQIVKNGIANRKFLASGSLENCGSPGMKLLNETKDESTGESAFGLSHFYSFILVPFLVASGAFFVPYFILGGHKARQVRSSDRERRPLLSNIDEPIVNYSPAQTADSH